MIEFIKRLKNNYFLILILVAAAVLRFYNIDFQSAWLDEIHSLNEANPNFSLAELYQSVLIADPHPPLYFLILHFLFQVFGYSTLVLRVFSALVGIGGVFAIYALGKELMTKKVGLYAALLTAVNYFHIFYSQEGRMYALLFFTTTLAFYAFVCFLKRPSLRTALIYGISSTFMIYCHFFALFALFSQYCILLFFIVRPVGIERKKLFIFSLLAGVMTLILYLPTLPIFQKAAESKSFWIDAPTVDVYTQIFKEFFGQSEIVLFFVIVLLLVFFVRLFSSSEARNLSIDPIHDKLVFSFFIVFSWIFITLFIPLVQSYMAVPMLISRYFINILPAVMVLLALGLAQVQSRIVRLSILGIIVVFSLTDIFIVKKYYHTVKKSQFRETSEFIKEKRNDSEPLVSSLGWYFGYYMQKEKMPMRILDEPLESYVNELKKSRSAPHSFWYADAHKKVFTLSDSSRKYLDSVFVVAHSTQLYDSWARHYIPLSGAMSEIDLSAYNLDAAASGEPFKYYVEEFINTDNHTKIAGWAFFEGQESNGSEITVVLVQDKKVIKLITQEAMRSDITDYFKSKLDLSHSGFEAHFQNKNLAPGDYKVGLLLKNIHTKKQGLVITDKSLQIKP